jgi:hypothetical protein
MQAGMSAWYSPKPSEGADLLEIVADVIGQTERDQLHGFVVLHVALDAIRRFQSVYLGNRNASSSFRFGSGLAGALEDQFPPFKPEPGPGIPSCS